MLGIQTPNPEPLIKGDTRSSDYKSQGFHDFEGISSDPIMGKTPKTSPKDI